MILSTGYSTRSSARFATDRIILRTLKRYANIFIPTASFIAARSVITGQNSFRDYFRMQIHPVLEELVGNLFDSEEDTEFLVTFLADGMVSTLIRWLNSSDPEPPEEMARRVRRTMVAISRAIVTTYEEEERKAAKNNKKRRLKQSPLLLYFSVYLHLG